ncbi:MAG: molybdate ABC transporter permease subunit [Pseudomonadota bacterium]|uniref:molybdate ABC transporter permease subunit n=1 Tax=Phenylobacterium sp. TaxID=1871053 RepID=UPI0025E5A646|nr:molybdate ABC transporter permease subunit [Phenylobacterium sp.]MBT9471479.1 molybdate ABC transporter permease subunit [Phenylobacterium sp.]
MSGLTPEDFAAVLLSLKVALAATLCGMPIALATAFAQARGRFAARVLLDAAVTLPLVLPPVATGYVLLLLFGRRGLIGEWLEKVGIVFAFDWTGAALAAGIMAFPLMVRPMRLAIEAIDREVDEVARTLGAGAVIRFFRVTLPLAAPGVAAGAILGFAKALGEFGATITFVAAIPGETLTLPAAIYGATQSPGGEARAAVLCLVAAAIAIAAVLVSDAVGRWAGRASRGSS